MRQREASEKSDRRAHSGALLAYLAYAMKVLMGGRVEKDGVGGEIPLELLRKMRLFHALSTAELQEVSRVPVPLFCRKGEVLITEGSTGSALYFVLSGELRVSQNVRGKQRELATFNSGDHFGEVSFLDRRPRSATIFASEDSELLVVARKDFERLLQDNPRLHNKVMKGLIKDLCDKLRERHNALDFELSDLLPVAVFETDRKGQITYANRSGLQAFGYTEDDFDEGLRFTQLIASSDRARVRRKLASRLHTDRQEYMAVRKSGAVFPVAIYWETLRRNRNILGIRATLVDITERKKVEESLQKSKDELELRVKERTAELRQSEERYAISVQGANDGLWDWNLKANEIYFSPRWKSMLGLEEPAIGNQPQDWLTRIHPDDLQRVQRSLEAHRRGQTPHLETEYRIRHNDGSYRWVLCRGIGIRNGKSDAHRIAGSQTDITDRKRMEERLVQNAFYDSLTGLPNRALFMDRLIQAIERARQSAERTGHGLFAVVYLDLDRFKTINDSLGHLVGDQLLVAVAQRLNAGIRPGDTVARLGGDEFAILLEVVRDSSDPIRVARRIQDAFHKPFRLERRDVFVTASIGIALSAGVGSRGLPFKGDAYQMYERPEDLLRDADLAMYRAKAEARSSYALFDEAMHAKACEALQTETDLRWAIERDEFRIFYQPIVRLDTGKLNGFEALARWEHPRRGLVSPDSFIPVAEETGLIVEIGRSILIKSCMQIKEWNTKFGLDLFVSVNVSAKQLLLGQFVQDVENALKLSDLEPEFLKLEITESLMMENRDSTVVLLPQLKALGIELSLDDFGTGYSSLSSLNHFPIDTLKVDKSFVHGVTQHPEKQQIVRTILALAKGLEINVVAEGVEEPEEMDLLRSLECDLAQGYHFAIPMNASDAATLIESQKQW